MALHPDDPPISPLRGIGRILTSAAAYRKVLQIVPSPVNGITLCQGNFTLMTDDLPGVIRGFGRVDPANEQAPDGHTVYEIGSIAKVFTGLLLADATLREIVQLDDPDSFRLGDRQEIRNVVENWVVWRDAGDWERFRGVWHDDGRTSGRTDGP